ncbi:hypothetical protein AXG93_3846s1040 [Marchantia polymorpha subsp. ruderalis]|uniref:GDSL esterase/lipase n=2 Tax=Marchantia polymorpha TaxID=3197 RepID=A0A176VME0_MARPO|nr:hypothetical protein AXG93_3846s1040 [Marchantia polymorpha subsp. ruderalis]
MACRAILVLLVVAIGGANGLTDCPTAFFNFGDSTTDTGSLENVAPGDPGLPPYGMQFFGEPSKRYAHGRVIPDFFALAFKTPLLQPYIQAGAYDFRHGVNFAVSGSTASNDSTVTPLYLPIQLNQFIRFYKTTESVKRQKGKCSPLAKFLPSKKAFENALYTIKFGGNDLPLAFLHNGSNIASGMNVIINKVIPDAMTNHENAMETLYRYGARRFLLTGLDNVGCSPNFVSQYSTFPLDDRGCLLFPRESVASWNGALVQLVERMRAKLTGASIGLFNVSAGSEEIRSNLSKFGFNPNLSTQVCCGAPGGPVDNNYNSQIKCGHPGSSVCDNVGEHIYWDGPHLTEPYQRLLAIMLLEAKYTSSGVNYTSLCNLDYSKFGDDVTFDEVYGDTCEVTFTS